MIKTQIQLSEDLYQKLKALTVAKETTLAELLRQGAEYIVRVHPLTVPNAKKWEPPRPKDLGDFLSDVSNWRELANMADEKN